jgi:transcriptional regulator with XRE-family HTH domain
MDSNQDTVTLEAFADRVGCHFTTASRLRSGDRMPSRELLGRIVEAYDLDRERTLNLFTAGTPDDFGKYLREEVFKGTDLSSVNLAGDREPTA